MDAKVLSQEGNNLEKILRSPSIVSVFMDSILRKAITRRR